MIHNINLNINLEINGLSRNNLMKIVDIVANGNGKMTFDELDKLFYLSPRAYIVASVDLPDLATKDYFIKETKIEIRG